MKKTLVLLAIIVLTLAFGVGEATAQPSSKFLIVAGSSLLYEGQAVILRGENDPNIGALSAHIGSGNLADIAVDETDYQQLHAMGANHIRFGLSFSWYSADPVKFFQVMDQQIGWASTHHIWFTPVMFTTPNSCYEGYSGRCGFWTSSSEQDALQAFWVAFAMRYANNPTVAGLDILNEPNPTFAYQWYDYADKVCQAIVNAAPNEFAVIESISAPSFPNPFKCSKVLYSVHMYSPIGFSTGSQGTYPGNFQEWDSKFYAYNPTTILNIPPALASAALNNLQERYSLNWAKAHNVPMLIGEWGATATNPMNGYNNYIQDVVTAFNSWGVSYDEYALRHTCFGSKNSWGIFPSYGPLTTPCNPTIYSVMAAAFRGSVQPDSNIPPVPTIVVALPTISPTVVTPPPTNTLPPAPTAIAVIPTLTPAPCPAPITVNEVVNGITYTGTLTAVCQ